MMLCATLMLLCAGDGVTVELPQAATVTGLEISVMEVAKVTGDSDHAVASVRSASLGYAPAPGYHRTLRADLIQASLRQALPGIDVNVTGAPRCRVTPATEVVLGDKLRAEASKALRAALLGLDAEARPEGSFPNIEVPRADEPVSIRVPVQRGKVFPGLRSIPIEVWVGGKLYRTVHGSFRVSIWKRQAVLKRAVNVGEPINASYFEVKRIPVGDAGGLQALGMYELAGAIALKPIPAGSVVTERDVHREVVMRRGDVVSVRIQKGAVTVTDVGMAGGDGRMGERVNVVLRSSGRELVAVVRGPKTLEVKIQ